MSAGTRLAATLRDRIAQVRAGAALGRAVRRGVAVPAFEDEQRERPGDRERVFLRWAERLIFAHRRSPYRPLLEGAGYDLAALRQLVMHRGLDAALDQLRLDGVYVSIREFKGTEPAVRRGRALAFQPADFATPGGSTLLHTTSGGSRGPQTPIAISADDLARGLPFKRWHYAHMGWTDRALVIYRHPALGAQLAVAAALSGRPPARWFALVPELRPATRALAVARPLSGWKIPRLEVVPPARAIEVVRAITQLDGGVLVNTTVTSALRLVLVADEAGIHMGDVYFSVGSEPLTPAKRERIERSGYRVHVQYATSEVTLIATGCPAGREPDDMHVLTHRVAVRRHEREVGGAVVPAYLVTTIGPNRHVFVNVETGDYGALEERRCGCFLDEAGYRLHVHTVRSFEKLNAEGITFIGPSLEEVLEEVLPRHFGGDGRHYQLVEAEDRDGITRLYLLVSPALGPLPEDGLRETLLRELSLRHEQRGYGRTIERAWQSADTVRVVRHDPLQTATGKVLHLHRDRGELTHTLEGPR